MCCLAQVEAPPEAPPEELVPDVEWWDARILADRGSYGNIIDGEPAQVGGRGRAGGQWGLGWGKAWGLGPLQNSAQHCRAKPARVGRCPPAGRQVVTRSFRGRACKRCGTSLFTRLARHTRLPSTPVLSTSPHKPLALAQLKAEAITNLVQHPVLIEPPAEAPPPPPQPLKLTKRVGGAGVCGERYRQEASGA